MQIRSNEPDFCDRCSTVVEQAITLGTEQASELVRIFACTCTPEQFWINLLRARQPETSAELRWLRRYWRKLTAYGDFDSIVTVWADIDSELGRDIDRPGACVALCVGCNSEVYVTDAENPHRTYTDHTPECPAQSPYEYLVRAY